jgi:nucleotide-binding universal stress UspA family protein
MSLTILVATDGTPAAMGALRMAQGLQRARACKVHVIGVVEPVPVFDAGFMVALPELELYESRQDALKHEIETQVASVIRPPVDWSISVESGPPGPRIVKRAGEISADIIVLGLGRHRPVDRIFGTETALQVIRVSHLPVLAVPENHVAVPTTACLGVDFSLFNQPTASAALSLMQVPWRAHLIHVMSGMEFLPTLSEEWRKEYEEEIEARLLDFGAGLEVGLDGQVEAHVLEGEPAHELLEFAEGRGIDLLVAGSHGHSFVGRLLMGSVSTRLIRGAKVPVLVVPPSDRWEADVPHTTNTNGTHRNEIG